MGNLAIVILALIAVARAWRGILAIVVGAASGLVGGFFTAVTVAFLVYLYMKARYPDSGDPLDGDPEEPRQRDKRTRSQHEPDELQR